MIISNKYIILTGILILGMGTLSQAQMYKWVDEDGVTQFTQEKRLEDAEIKQIDKENQAIMVENCRRSRARLAGYSVPNALMMQPDGSRIRVDEDARQRELAEARENISKYCK